MIAQRKHRIVVSVLILFATVLAACVPVAAPVAPPAPAATEPAKQEAAAPPTEKYKFAVVPGAVHPFFDPYAPALKDLAKDVGIPEATLQMPQHFDQNEQNVILDGLVAKGYKGIAVFPSDPVAGNAQISKMVEQGITVVSLGGCPNQPTKALFCIATDQNTFAYKEAKQLIEALGGKGKIVHLTGMLADVNAQKYIKAVEQAVAEYPGVELVQTIGDLDTAEPAQNAVSNLLAAKRDQIDGIVASSHFSSLAVAAKMRELDEKRIKVVTINTDPSVLAAIKDGYVLGTMAQNAYGQAYLAVYSLKLLADGYTWKKDAPFEIDSGLFLVRAPNIDTVPQDLANLTKQLQADWKEKYFDPPK